MPTQLATAPKNYRRAVEDLGILVLSLLAVECFITAVPLLAAVGALVCAALFPPRAGYSGAAVAAAAVRKAGIVVLTGLSLRYWLAVPLTPLWFGVFWFLFPFAFRGAVALARAIKQGPWSRLKEFDLAAFRKKARVLGAFIAGGPNRQEFERCVILAGGTLFLMRGFASTALNGTDDALWYATMLADTVAQVRHGVFPIWLGQSTYQFNGAIYPLRVAPAFHYLGALLDTLTFHSMGVFALQNLLLTLVALAAVATAYACLRSLIPAKPWLAAGLAALFLWCPGVLGIVYNTDLYMSWTTVPTVPLIWFATVRSFKARNQCGPMLLLGASLGLCWWGHSPIALWSTLLAFAAQVVRLVSQRHEGVPWKPILAGVVAFGLISAYPIGSVLLFPPEPGTRADSFQKATAGTINYFLNQAFPATLLPLSSKGRSLGDFQVGYALWAVFGISLLSIRRVWRSECLVPLGAAVLLALLLFPIPGVNLWLWSAIPSFVRDTTGNWVMNRLYLPLAGALVFGAAACAAAGLMEGKLISRSLAIVVSFGCAWTFVEAVKFGNGSNAHVRSKDSAVDQLRPENVQITRFSYLVFPRTPSTFTHGVTDPEMENHLLGKDIFAQVATNLDSALRSGRVVAESDFRGSSIRGGIISLGKPIHIVEGRHYLLAFDFAHPEIPGVLQIAGPHFLREYALPEHGGEKAFGAGGEHVHALSVWTTAGSEDLTVRFIPIPAIPAGQAVPAIGHVRLLEYAREALPVRVDGWIPYKARVQSPVAGWLETPRMFQSGYAATVDNAPSAVTKSPDGFVSVAVPKGDSDVELRYFAPGGLQLLFWLSLLSTLGFASFAAVTGTRQFASGN
jgi:hypothetical protein